MSRDIFMKDMKRNICYGLELETFSLAGSGSCSFSWNRALGRKRRLLKQYSVLVEDLGLSGRLISDYGFPLMAVDYNDAEDFKTDMKEIFLVMQRRKDKENLRELLRAES